MEADIVVDARGHRCPTPTLKLRRALELAAPGAAILLVADDPLARIDVPHFLAEAGADLERLEVDGRTLRFLIAKPAQAKNVHGAPLRERNDAPPG